jgi:hypothetical protein
MLYIQFNQKIKMAEAGLRTKIVSLSFFMPKSGRTGQKALLQIEN